MGDSCEDPKKVCDALSDVDVCINGGQCQNHQGSAVCHCPIGKLYAIITQGLHRLEKYLNLESFLEKSLKIKSALKSTGKMTQKP